MCIRDRAGSLPEEPGLPTTCHQTQYHDVQPVSGNVRTPDAPVSSHLRSASGHLVTSGTTTLEPMVSLSSKPQATYANGQSVGVLRLDQSATAASAHAPTSYNTPVVLTLKDNTRQTPEVLTLATHQKPHPPEVLTYY